jgi:tetratricopeptide (TPR) repeat protein
MKVVLQFAALALALSTHAAGFAQSAGEHEHEHSHIAEGKPPEQLGHVSFANSCGPAVQPSFERAVALLHSFWFRESEKAFRDVLDRDPSCAIATWGIATVLIGNTFATGPTPAQAQQAREAIERGRAIGARSERERLFIDAVAAYYEHYPERPHRARMQSLSDVFAHVAARFPDDDEAQIFSALYLASTQDPSEQTFAVTLKAAAILEAQFKKHPDHPGVAHYLIHSYDYPPIADKGLAAARRYAAIAPSAPHALHMPSHIFTRVGAWSDSADSNLHSANVAKAEKEFNNQLHAMDYMVYAYLQMGRDGDALRLVEEAPGVHGDDHILSTPYALAAIPARYALERGEWSEAAHLQPQQTRFRLTTAITYFARAIGGARSGDVSAAEADVQELARIVDALNAAKDKYWATEVEVQRLGATAWVAYAKGDRQTALQLMQSAAALEDKSEKAAVSPGRLVPAHELLGDMLLESNRPDDALAEYERAQVRDPNRFRSLYGAGLAAATAGKRDQARLYWSRLSDMAGSGELRPETRKARLWLANG